MTSQPPSQPDNVLVRKYGGSSLESVDRIAQVARDICRARAEGYQLVVVVSAMGKTTNELETLAREANPTPPRREMDMLLSVGERITMSLLSMALAAEGCPSISFTGSQVGIITDTSHTDARIIEVKGDRVRESLAKGFTVVVAGFQGVSREKEITTLGRGGSDTTAVALAAALGAVRCEILKDVDGVLSADPDQVTEAWAHDSLSYDEMRQIADSGSGVVHPRAVEFAAAQQVPLVVRSSFHEAPGTRIGPVPGGGCGPQTAPCDRQNRYRPLSMITHSDVSRLRLGTPDPDRGIAWRDQVLDTLDPACLIAEWMDCGPAFRWEVLAPELALVPLADALTETPMADGDTFRREDGLTCISFAGGRPDSWLEVQRHLSELLAAAGCGSYRLRADGSALRIILPTGFPPALPSLLHRALLPR